MAADATGFAALHPSVQYLIVNQLRWPGLRPVQELSVAPILRGDNAVVLAPTAGGKTEAAFFPALSRLLQENWAGLSILYVSPIRALLNNQGERLQNLCQALGLTAQIWHGDVTASAKKRMRQAPPNVMLTTPESLEAILVSPSRSASRMFGGLRIVVIDEVHAFAGADRGWHLLGVLNRLQQRCGHDIQRVGLSATVGNRSGIVDWLSAGSVRGRTTIDPPRPPGPEPDVVVDFVGSLENAATVIARLHAGEKRLVFCDSRAQAEQLTRLLRAAGVNAHVTHGSLGKEERTHTERQFSEGGEGVIVATSALELGIDIGDLDRVIQIDAPFSVASFLQRMGRTGRRPGTRANCLFLCLGDTALLRACAIVDAWTRGEVEPAEAPAEPWHVAAQQLMARVLEMPGAGRTEVLASLAPWAAVALLDEAGRAALLDSLVANDWIFEEEGRLSMGGQGEQSLGKRHFMKLMSVFTTPPLFKVMHGPREVGQVGHDTFDVDDRRPQAVLLGGKTWLVTRFDWKRAIAHVEPMEGSARVKYVGEAAPMGPLLAAAHRRVLVGEATATAAWSRRASARMETQLAQFDWLALADEPAPMWDRLDAVDIYTFAGDRRNRRMAVALVALGAISAVPTALRIAVKVSGASALRDVRRLWQTATSDPPPLAFDADAAVKTGLKFEKLLPPELAFRAMLWRVYGEGVGIAPELILL